MKQEELRCPKCQNNFKRVEVKYVEEYPPLFKGLPILVQFICPRCQVLVTIKMKEEEMKIIMVDNFNREGPGHDDKLIVEMVGGWWGETIVSLLNGFHSKDPNNSVYFKLVEDHYKLYKFEP